MQHLCVFHHVDDDEQGRKEGEQVPVDFAIEAVRSRLVLEQREDRKRHGHVAHA